MQPLEESAVKDKFRPRSQASINLQNRFAILADTTDETITDICAVESAEKLTQESGLEPNVADVKKPLASAVRVVQAGNRVVMDEEGSYIENVWTQDKIWLREDNGVYVLDMVVVPPEKRVESGFPRPGMQQ